MSNYSVFSKFYDAAMGDMDAKIDFLKSLIKKYNPHAETVLEMASGTGTILEGLMGDYEVYGVDLSPEMVAVSKEKLSGVDIRVGDMTDFDFEKKFDAVLCVYDSINHLPEWQQWEATIENAHRHLKDNGIFIFDFNTIEQLGRLANDPPYGREMGTDYMIMDIRNESSHYNWDIKVFEKNEDGRFTLHQDNVYEVSFPLTQVKEAVLKNFTIEAIDNPKGRKEGEPGWRPFFVCRKI